MSAQFNIAIVGLGAVLPDAAGVEEYWQRLLSGTSSISELPLERWSPSVYQAAGIPENERPVTRMAGHVTDAVLAVACHRAGIAADAGNRLSLMSQCAVHQALSGLELAEIQPNRRATLLGCMDLDEAALKLRFVEEELPAIKRVLAAVAGSREYLARLRSHLREGNFCLPEAQSRAATVQPASILARLQQRWQLDGPAALIDAACASSLVAIDQALHLLRSHRVDLVVAGGVESNLGPDTYALFGCLGALSPDRCLPLDPRSRGLSQGEGAVAFVLERLEDAQQFGHPIHGVLRGSGVASDGSAASLFEPTSAGQLRALRQAYQGINPESVAYVECHATGTAVGDATELNTIKTFFGDRRLPVGSVKAMTGHTKGAAGAAGLLKCVLSLRHRRVPPSAYSQQPDPSRPGPWLNPQPLPLDPGPAPLTMGVSAFGFGGINAHLVLQHDPGLPTVTARPEADSVVLVARHYLALAGVHEGDLPRIPPNSRQQIDELQLAAVLATREAFTRAGLRLDSLDRDRISVIAAGTTGIEAIYRLSHRIRLAEAEQLGRAWPEDLQRALAKCRERHPPVTEDTGPGVLNNVIAGRVANYFDWRGPSFAVDAESVSEPVALWLAAMQLEEKPGLLVLLAAQEVFKADEARVERQGLTCWLLGSRSWVLEQALPIEAELAVQFAGRSQSTSVPVREPESVTFP